ncbi:penicillin-binding transpeptidase domain-containing protein [Nocardioides sp.]|uniref:penicillin-binding transpeptidase domain-containing protein n=1 Tax=Nocardioides sp. TaxID=35761 RepID=UPI001A2E81A7|nr:penicillin-binding transpeptidase domain-containing protein [Nocardioides sp.]MBJ7357203.1 penicillin-binding protein [Nocardioides sp.]
MRARSGQTLGRGLAVLLVLGLLVGCTGDGDDGPDPDQGPTPEATAEALATGLQSGDLIRVAFDSETAEGAQAAYDEVLAGMGDRPRTVEVVDVEEGSEGDAAEATLRWSWELGGEQPWTYDVVAPLTEGEAEWQATWATTLVEPSLEPGDVLDLASLTPDRGDILGARGLGLVTERQVSRVGIDKPSVEASQAGASARALAKLVGIDAKEYAKRVEAAGPQAFVEAIVYRQEEVDPGLLQAVEAIAGARLIGGSLPLAPTREFAAPLLGRVGEVTAEMIEESPDKYQVGDVAGISGLQARYDDTLRGSPGVKVSAIDDQGAAYELFRSEPVPGQPLQLSLDLDLQVEAERLLADVTPASALVALRPSTGEILVAANGPGTGGLNLATFGQFAPGSTFKSVSALALLRAGLTPQSVVPCTARVVVDGKTFTNYDDYPSGALGDIPLRTALANSCNTAFISQAPRLQGTDLFDAGVSLGIGLDHDLGFPAYFGSVEPSSSKTESAAQLIGQGTILASPMVMAAVIGSAQSGRLVIPRLVEGVDVSPPEGAQPLEPAESEALRSMLRAVVTDGSGRGLADVPGPPVIAKTGTAEFGAGDDLQTHAWMIAAQGDLAVAVFVEVGASGSGTAGPILEAFLRAAQ